MDDQIYAKNNGNYGGNLINQKYSPLDQIRIEANQQDFYKGIFNQRIESFAELNFFPKKLNLYARWDPKPPNQPRNLNPPMIVISSKRAWWLRTLLINMQNQYEVHAPTSYNDYSAFSTNPVPWYAPLRTGNPNRHCYIVVHKSEYFYYVRALRDLNHQPFVDVTIVGYEYKGGYPLNYLAGFGASRYAALAMGINLGYEKAWLVDDNVAQIRGFPDNLETVEENLDNQIYAISFGAATNNLDLNIRDALDRFRNIQENFTENYKFADAQPGVLQQVVLWNLKLLSDNKITVSPYFCASNEDVSLAKYLQKTNRQQKVVTSCTIIKISPDNTFQDIPDDLKKIKDKSQKEIEKIIKKLLKKISNVEKNIIVQNSDKTTDLLDYIKNTVLVECTEGIKNEDPYLTESKAVEQSLSAAIDQIGNLGWVPERIFNPYDGFTGNTIQRIMVKP